MYVPKRIKRKWQVKAETSRLRDDGVTARNGNPRNGKKRSHAKKRRKK